MATPENDRQLYLMLGEMSSDLKTVVRGLDDLSANNSLLEKRISALEHFRTRATLVATAAGAAVSAGVSLGIKFLTS